MERQAFRKAANKGRKKAVFADNRMTMARQPSSNIILNSWNREDFDASSNVKWKH
jgi:hypothetical protein